MNVDKITTTKSNYGSTVSQIKQDKKDKPVKPTTEKPAAVYDQGEDVHGTKPTYQRDTATVERLLEESERRSASLRSLVEKMLLKQGETITDATDIYALLREGKVEVDPEVRAQAQKDISEDGYWGIAKTSERLVSFAKALAGGDPSKAETMIEAVKKGFEEATKTWGGELPTISKETINSTIRQLEEWRDSIS